MAVGVRHEFIGLFGGRVKGNRRVNPVLHAEGDLFVGPVNGGGRGIHEVFNAVFLASSSRFRNPPDCFSHRKRDPSKSAGPRPVRPDCTRCGGRAFGKSTEALRSPSDPPRRSGTPRNPREDSAAPFQTHVIVGVQVVQSDHPGSRFQKPLGQVKTDKPRGSGHQ